MKSTVALFLLSLSARTALASPWPEVDIQERGCTGTCWNNNNFKGFVKCVPKCILGGNGKDGEDIADDLSSSEEEDNLQCSDGCFRKQDKDPNAAKTPGGFTAYDQEEFDICLHSCYVAKGIIEPDSVI
ncbi:hypothetical protein F5X99DRAFT_381712 [Biscogniauxia marginata]|nr:hypothetical protein F5X99DRAFT_381712 [Biscogniauxia marginata]